MTERRYSPETELIAAIGSTGADLSKLSGRAFEHWCRGEIAPALYAEIRQAVGRLVSDLDMFESHRPRYSSGPPT